MSHIPLEDVEELRRLTVRYMTHLDRFNVSALLELFTEDVVWDGSAVGHGRHEGIGNLMNFFMRGQPGQPMPERGAHIVANHLVESIEEDCARGTCYFFGQSYYPDRGIEVEAGIYLDEYTRQDDRWRFSSRLLTPLIPARFHAVGTPGERS